MASQYYQSLIIVDSDHKAFPFPTVGPCVGNFGIRKPPTDSHEKKSSYDMSPSLL